MKIELPQCNFTECKWCFDGNCQKQSKYERCSFRELTENNTDLITMSLAKDVTIQKLNDEIERLRAEEKQSQILIKTLHDKLDEGYAKFVDEERADTVRKMQSEIKKYYSQPKYLPTPRRPIKHTTIDLLFAVIDQIAKELLGGK